MPISSHLALRIFISHSNEDNSFGIKLAQESYVVYSAMTPPSGTMPWAVLESTDNPMKRVTQIIPSPKLRQGISRRMIIASLVGLAGLVTTVGSGMAWWIHAHPTEAQKAKIGTTLVIYRGHERKIRGLAWSLDGKRIASASADKTVRVWQAV